MPAPLRQRLAEAILTLVVCGQVPQSASVSAYDALLVLSFGGPEAPEHVLPFLENVTRGRGIPAERLLEVAAHYDHFGGKSPINDQCRDLIRALRPALDAAGIGLPIYWGTRNWDPLLGDTASSMRGDGVANALVFTTSSFSSYSSCRQYRENLDAASDSSGLRFDKLRQHWNHPLFIDAVVERTVAALAAVSPSARGATRLVFTAHSIPSAMAAGCRYEQQLAEAARLVSERVGMSSPAPIVAFQSRSGPPSVPWLEPDIRDALSEQASGGARAVVVVPIGFTSDHLEVLWDLDHDAASVAHGLGLEFHRAATVGTHPAFVSMIVDLVRERLESHTIRPVAGTYPAEADQCAPNCCTYVQRRPPTSQPA